MPQPDTQRQRRFSSSQSRAHQLYAALAQRGHKVRCAADPQLLRQRVDVAQRLYVVHCKTNRVKQRDLLGAVVEFGGTEVAAGRLMNIGPKDLLIAISFPRYARDRCAHVIALTDSMAPPLVTSRMVSGNNQVAQAEKLTDAISAYLYTDKPGNDSGVDRPAKRIVRG